MFSVFCVLTLFVGLNWGAAWAALVLSALSGLSLVVSEAEARIELVLQLQRFKLLGLNVRFSCVTV